MKWHALLGHLKYTTSVTVIIKANLVKHHLYTSILFINYQRLMTYHAMFKFQWVETPVYTHVLDLIGLGLQTSTMSKEFVHYTNTVMLRL